VSNLQMLKLSGMWLRRVGVALLLTACGATAPAVEPQVAPQIDLSLEGLSAPIEEADGTVCLPPDLADAIDLQREQARVLPSRCQARLDIMRERVEAAHSDKWWDRAEWALMGGAATAIIMSLIYAAAGGLNGQ